MLDTWLDLAGSVLRPSRPHVDRCVRERAAHLASRRSANEEQTRAIAECERRIERARADVFAAKDGVVSARMTELEREWRSLSRDADDGFAALWERIAPASWRAAPRSIEVTRDLRLEMAVGLASDPEGVEAAEAAAATLRDTLGSWGGVVGHQLRWRSVDERVDGGTLTQELLAKPVQAVIEGLDDDARDGVLDRARKLGDEVATASAARLTTRGVRARMPHALSYAAFVEYVWHAYAETKRERTSPIAPLKALWKTGYVLAAVDASGVTLAIDLSDLPSTVS